MSGPKLTPQRWWITYDKTDGTEGIRRMCLDQLSMDSSSSKGVYVLNIGNVSSDDVDGAREMAKMTLDHANDEEVLDKTMQAASALSGSSARDMLGCLARIFASVVSARGEYLARPMMIAFFEVCLHMVEQVERDRQNGEDDAPVSPNNP